MSIMEIFAMIELIATPKYLWAFASIVAFLSVIIAVVRMHLSDKYKNFDLIELFAIDQVTGKLSDSKVRLNTAFVLTAWAFVYLVMNDKFTEWYFTGFMVAWVSDRFLARKANTETKESE